MAEGVRLLEEALRHRVKPRTVYFAPSLLSARGEKLVARFRRGRVDLEEVPARTLTKLSDTATPQGVVGLFATPQKAPAELYDRRFRNILLCEDISDPGNLGTLLRSALAFGFEMVLLCGSCAEPYSPKVLRSSVGAG